MKLIASVGDVVIIHEDYVPRSLWRLGIVEGLSKGKDGLVRGAKVRVGKTSTLVSRPVTKLYPVEYFRFKAPKKDDDHDITRPTTASIRSAGIIDDHDITRPTTTSKRSAGITGELRRRWNVVSPQHSGGM